MDPQVFLTGIAVGTGLLLIGLGIGWYFGRRVAAEQTPAVHERHMLDAVRSFAALTSDFAGDFSQYQAKLSRLTEHARSAAGTATNDEVQSLLGEIFAANRLLQSRLDNAEVRLEQQTKELGEYLTEARTDVLTGLPNRRSFDGAIDEVHGEWKRHRTAYSLALLDIDFFKSINDNCGHPAGDAVLVEVARRLRDFARDEFVLGRYGGEEFAVLLRLPCKPAAAQIERLRTSIAAQPVAIDGHDLRVTVSCGVAEVRSEKLGDLFQRADEALYSAKIGGRNRVYLQNGTLCEAYGTPGPPEGPRFAPTATADMVTESERETLRERVQQRFDELIATEMQRKNG